MSQHHDWVTNPMLVVVMLTASWWIEAIEGYSWIAGKLILPTLAIAIGIYQIRYWIKKHNQLGKGDKDSK